MPIDDLAARHRGLSSEGRSQRDRFRATRRLTEELCRPLATEDYVVQSMPDASPTKWHLAHVSWFFETFVLANAVPNYRSLHPRYSYLFNSYYNAVGNRQPRPKRGLLSRPTVEETFEYRAYVDSCMEELFGSAEPEILERVAPVIELGIHHEQQHQELIVTDLKHMLSENPLRPVYLARNVPSSRQPAAISWIEFPESVSCIGHEGEGFAFDNECPRHREFVAAFALSSRPVTNREYLEFMEDGGYRRSEFWLSEGWNAVQSRDWQAPLYWESDGADWQVFTLSGMRPVDPHEPVCHVSFYEADAYASWAGARLSTEAEWEIASLDHPIQGNFVESRLFHPAAATCQDGKHALGQLFGDVWEWTRSPYIGYPGFKATEGALGEYNGKFMCNQLVLRGGSCATPQSHIRRTYRNFFPPDARWQFMGIRLARDA